MQATYKIVMIGDFGVGKTSLVQRFVNNSFSEEYLSTIGVSISKKTTQNSTILLWDIEGHTEYKPIFKQYLSGAKGFMIVADLTRQETLDSLKDHIDLTQQIVPDTPIVIALNKADIVQNIEQKRIDELFALHPNIVGVEKTSAKEALGVEELFLQLDEVVRERLSQ